MTGEDTLLNAPGNTKITVALAREWVELAWKDGYAKGVSIHSDFGWHEHRDSELRNDCWLRSDYAVSDDGES